MKKEFIVKQRVIEGRDQYRAPFTAWRGGPRRIFTSDARVRLSRTRDVFPDASVSCNEQDRRQSDMVQFPCLVVEVVSPITEGYDRGRKFAYYPEFPTIQEYLLIEIQCTMVEVYRLERHDLWVLRAFRIGEEVELVNLACVFPLVRLQRCNIFTTG